MKYWFDCEFIEDGKTIDLISIGIVAEDGRTMYLQSVEFNSHVANDWVWRNVFPHLEHFSQRREARSCAQHQSGNSIYTQCDNGGCPWRTRLQIADDLRTFCHPQTYGKPEIWGYYADYDWVALCQLFGTMMDLPKDWPMYCRDVKQLCDSHGNPKLPEQKAPEHNALNDAMWTKVAWEFLNERVPMIPA